MPLPFYLEEPIILRNRPWPPTQTMTPPEPVLSRPDATPSDVLCPICMELPVDPVITPCEHIFCKGCVTLYLERQANNGGAQECPMDRQACECKQLKPLKGFALRIWSNIEVKCGNHNDGCAWTGSVGDFATHAKFCGSGRLLREMVSALEKENTRLENEIRAAKATMMSELKNKAGGGLGAIKGIMTWCDAFEQIEEKEGIDLVMSQAKCSRAKAIEALYDNDGDLVNAIMSLTT